MRKQTCPYLGMQEDPTTALDFPSEGNICHRSEPASPVNKIHQQRYCLTAGHFGCPVYRAARPVAMPPALLPPAARREQAARVASRLAAKLLPVLVLGIAVLGLALWIVAPQILGIDRSVIPDTGDEPSGDTSFNLFSFGDARDQTLTPFLPQFRGPSGEMAVPNCPMPTGWATYITNPTDSLFRLSVVYGVTVAELQRVNCKDESDTVILPGQVIYVPAVAQGTLPSYILSQDPTAFPTFTPQSIVVRQVTSTPSSGSGNNTAPSSTPLPTSTVRVVTNTPLPTAIKSATPAPTNIIGTATLRPTNTLPPPPTATPQPTRTRRPTNTPKPTNTPAPTNTPKPTNTPVPTDPPPPTATNPPPPMNTPQPTDTPEPPPPTNTPQPPPPTDPPPPTEPPPTDTPPPPTATDPPPPTATDPPPDITEPAPGVTEPPPDITEPAPGTTEMGSVLPR